MKIVPHAWREFQHYTNRNPPWIRLHRKLLDNFEFQRLPVASRALAPMLWLLASESVDGTIDAEPEKLAFRLRQTTQETIDALKPLLDNGFFEILQTASTPLAQSKHAAPKNVPETETEAETERDTEADSETEALQKSSLRSDFSPGVAVATTTAPAKSRRPSSKARNPAPTAGTWDAYSAAFTDRYGTPPVRNASVNGQLAQLVAKLGAEAPAVAAFYVAHQRQDYVRSMHDTALLLRDASGLRTQWATRTQVTHAQAVQTDRTQTNLNAFAPLIAEAKAREAAAAQQGDLV